MPKATGDAKTFGYDRISDAAKILAHLYRRSGFILDSHKNFTHATRKNVHPSCVFLA